MTHKVSVGSTSGYSVKLKTTRPKVNTGAMPPTEFEDLGDFDPAGLQDKYIIMYDAVTKKYKPVNPDEVLVAAVTNAGQVGLPTVFTAELGNELDNEIDVDAGGF